MRRASSNESKQPPRNRRPKKSSQRRGRSGNLGGTTNVIQAGRVYTTEVIQKSIPLFGSRTVRRLRYSTNFQLTSTAGAVASYVFAANGLYDPDITGTGHQPMGFDEMMLYYNHYTVVRADFQMVSKCVSATKLTVSMRQDGASTPLTVIDRIVEVGGGVIDYLELASTYGATKRSELAVDIAKLQGLSRVALTADSSLRGTVAANPAELTYVHIQVWDAAAQTGAVNFDVIIDFTAVFTEPRDITESLLSSAVQHLRIAESDSCKHDESKTVPKKGACCCFNATR